VIPGQLACLHWVVFRTGNNRLDFGVNLDTDSAEGIDFHCCCWACITMGESHYVTSQCSVTADISKPWRSCALSECD